MRRQGRQRILGGYAAEDVWISGTVGDKAAAASGSGGA